MKTHHLLIPKNIILPISILGFIFTVIGTLLKLSHWSFGIFTPNLVLSISIVFTLLAIFVVLLDIIKNHPNYLHGVYHLLQSLLKNLPNRLYRVHHHKKQHHLR